MQLYDWQNRYQNHYQNEKVFKIVLRLLLIMEFSYGHVLNL